MPFLAGWGLREEAGGWLIKERLREEEQHDILLCFFHLTPPSSLSTIVLGPKSKRAPGNLLKPLFPQSTNPYSVFLSHPSQPLKTLFVQPLATMTVWKRRKGLLPLQCSLSFFRLQLSRLAAPPHVCCLETLLRAHIYSYMFVWKDVVKGRALRSIQLSGHAKS